MNIMRKRLWNSAFVVPTIVGAPETEEDLKRLKPFEFQNWVIDKIYGSHSPRKSRDMGIDGYTFLDRFPVQVKQSERVGRNVVDNFETAIRRAGHDTGYVFAFSYTKDAVEEVARAKWNDRIDIRLVRINKLLKPEDELPKPLRRPEGDLVPMPEVRKPNDLPAPEVLIESDQAETG